MKYILITCLYLKRFLLVRKIIYTSFITEMVIELDHSVKQKKVIKQITDDLEFFLMILMENRLKLNIVVMSFLMLFRGSNFDNVCF